MCNILRSYNDPENFDRFLSLLLSAIKEKILDFVRNPNYYNFSIVKNYLVFFMIVTLNLGHKADFIKSVFRGKGKFFGALLQAINPLPKNKKTLLLNILNNLFMGEYKDIYFNQEERNLELEELFIQEQTKFSKIYIEGLYNYEEKTYRKMFEILRGFDLSYDNFFSYHSDSISFDDRPVYKLMVVQGIIRILFSKEKNQYVAEGDLDSYEYDILKKIIDKNMSETLHKFQDDYKTLFRKEDILDDIIKYMFFIFGNTLMIESFFKPVNAILKGEVNFNSTKNIYEYYSINNDTEEKETLNFSRIKTRSVIFDDVITVEKEAVGESSQNLEEAPPNSQEKTPSKIVETAERCITKQEFDYIMDVFIEKLPVTLPFVLKFLLKIVYSSALSFFTISKDNYGPLFTLLIFNFVISPRVQGIYGLNPMKSEFVRTLNKLVYNSYCNKTFAVDEPMSEFNSSISKYNVKLKEFVN